MAEEKKHFLTTLPGILTGIAAVITAITGLYLASNSSNERSFPTNPINQPITEPSIATPLDWPLIIDETFTNNSNGWNHNNYPTEQTPRFDLRIINGRYRWDAEYTKNWQRHVYAPTGTFVNVNLGVDVKTIEYTPEVAVSLIFGATESRQYAFTVSTNGQYNLSKIDGPDSAKKEIIGWTRFNEDFNPKKWNRLGVVVNNKTINLYVNSILVGRYEDNNYSGGKVGLGLDIFKNGIAVIDFDNFQLRHN